MHTLSLGRGCPAGAGEGGSAELSHRAPTRDADNKHPAFPAPRQLLNRQQHKRGDTP